MGASSRWRITLQKGQGYSLILCCRITILVDKEVARTLLKASQTGPEEEGRRRGPVKSRAFNTLLTALFTAKAKAEMKEGGGKKANGANKECRRRN